MRKRKTRPRPKRGDKPEQKPAQPQTRKVTVATTRPGGDPAKKH